MTDADFSVGDEVIIGTQKEKGIIKFKGQTAFNDQGIWYGIELHKPKGKNDGTVQGQRYFECKPEHGIFVRVTVLTKVEASAASPTKKKAPTRTGTKDKEKKEKDADGDGEKVTAKSSSDDKPEKSEKTKPVRTTTKEKTTKKAAASADKAEKTEDGEKAEKSEKDSESSPKKAPTRTGTKDKDKDKDGAPAKPKRVATKEKKEKAEKAEKAAAAPAAASSTPEAESSPASTHEGESSPESRPKLTTKKSVHLGNTDTVEVEEVKHDVFKMWQRVGLFSQSGVVRFVGNTKFSKGLWIGLELDNPVGKCDGSVGGHRYFECADKHGLFLMAPDVDSEAVQNSVGGGGGGGGPPMMRNRSMSMGGGGRRRSFSRANSGRARLLTQQSGFGDEIIVAEEEAPDLGSIQILDDQGEPVNIEDLIAAFEDTRIELEGVQELLDTAQERENDLRRQLNVYKSGGGGAAGGGGQAGPAADETADVPRGVPIGTPETFDNLILLADSSKVSNHLQYPSGTEKVYSYFECRGGKFQEVCFFGLQYFLKKYLVGRVISPEKINSAEIFFQTHFSHPKWGYNAKLFNRAGWEYIAKRHKGHLPVTIKSVPEGTVVPCQNVLFSVENTDNNCYWLTSYLETLLVQVWYPTTVATHSREQKQLIQKYLKETGSEDIVAQGLHKFKLHDFGFRGLTSVESSGLGGAAHLVNFLGSDTMSALVVANDFYHCDCGAYSMASADPTVAATWGKEQEVEAMRSLLAKCPTGLVAWTSGSANILSACEKLGDLKPLLEQRDGCLLVQSSAASDVAATVVKVLEAMSAAFGSKETSTGHKVLPPSIRLVQGGGLAMEAMTALLEALKAGSWAAENLSFASVAGASLKSLEGALESCGLRCSAATVKGEEIPIALASDPEQKKGRLTLELKDGQWTTTTEGKGDPDADQLVEVFRDGKLLIDDSLESIRKRSEGSSVAPAPATGLGASKPFWRTGSYLKEKAAELRGVSDNLLGKLGKLKDIQVARSKRAVDPVDVRDFSKLYEDNNGDLEKLAEILGIPKQKFTENPPKNAEDFARSLLSGQYTGVVQDEFKEELRSAMLKNLDEQKGKLKRTTTKESSGEANSTEIGLVATLYTQAGGNLKQIAEKYGLSLEKMEKCKPKDAEDFGRRLLAGQYTEDNSAAAVSKLRQTLQDDLRRSISNLKRTSTKEATGDASPEDIERIAGIYTKHRGNLDQIARVCGASVSLLKRNPPQDPRDFAKKLLEGVYTGDNSSIARAELRDRLKEDLQASAHSLKRVTTKEATGATEKELAAVAQFYYDKGENLSEIAKALNLPEEALTSREPPADGRDFAKRLLMGEYTVIETEEAKKKLRTNLMDSLVQRKNTLKRTTTKEGGQPDPVFLSFVGKIFTEADGDLAQIAQKCGISLKLLQDRKPNNADEFAKALCNGEYSSDMTESAKAELRDRLKEDLQSQLSKLKPAVAKEKAEVGTVELAKFSAAYTKCRGSPEQLAQQFGLNPEVLRQKPPENPTDFARKLLDGFYTGETSEVAKAVLRNRLRDDLHNKASTLKRTQTKDRSGAALVPSNLNKDDVEKCGLLYANVNGDLNKLAELLQIDVGMLENKKPKDAADFAVKLLCGEFTGDKTELQRKFLVKRLRNDLEQHKSLLKRTSTKERAMNDVAQADIDMVATVYDNVKGDLTELAKACGLNRQLLESNKPTDGKDFAKKLLLGHYHRDLVELNKANLRETLAEKIKSQQAGLKRTTTKESTGVASAQDIAAVVKFYNDQRGSLEQIAKITGANLDLLKKNAPSDAEDFAKKLLQGLYTGDAPAVAVSKFRDALKEDLQASAGKLRRTATKETNMLAGASKEEIEAFKPVWEECKGSMATLSQKTGIDLAVLEANPPRSLEHFVQLLFSGAWDHAKPDQVKANLRKDLKANVEKKMSTLKRTTTKERQLNDVSPEDVQLVLKVWEKNGGDLTKVARACGINQRVLMEAEPESGEDFAKKFLLGHYNRDMTEVAKNNLRQNLRDELTRTATNLKRTTTKEASGAPTTEDLQAVCKIYSDNRGSLETLAKICGANLDLMKSSPPSDALDFATKLLEGAYTGDTPAIALKKLRDALREDLQSQAGNLRRTTTKERSSLALPSKEEVECIKRVYRDHDGNLESIADAVGVAGRILRANPPKNAEDFAVSLLMGKYTIEVAETAKASVRNQLKADLNRQMSSLKRTTTKEKKGEAGAEDMVALSEIFEKYDGDLAVIAEKYALDLDTLKKNPPRDGIDFGKALLAGEYTLDKSEGAKAKLRDQLKIDLGRQMSSLKRTATKEGSGAASEEDIVFFAKLFDDNRGKFESLAKLCKLNVEKLQKDAPANGRTFAVKLLAGQYSGDASDFAAAKLRKELKNGLAQSLDGLKRTTTKEGGNGLSAEDKKMAVDLFKKYGDDLGRLADTVGVPKQILIDARPATGDEFAKGLFSGQYSVDVSAVAASKLREKLASSLEEAGKTLKKTTTKEYTGVASQQELDAVAAIYDKEGAALLEKMVSEYGLSKSLLDAKPPKDGKDFAMKLLAGQYSADSSEQAKASLRAQMKLDLSKAAGGLKRTTTKEASGAASAEDIKAVAKLYDQCGGNLKQLAQLCGMAASIIEKKPPANGQDFATKLLAGVYDNPKTFYRALISAEDAKAKLQAELANGINRQMSSLRRTATKEGSGAATEEDIALFAKFYDEKNGDLDALATACKLSADLLKQTPPANGREFAARLLSGAYTGEISDLAAAKLRKDLKDDITKSLGGLKRTETKEGARALTAEDKKMAIELYTKHDGDIGKIAEAIGSTRDALEKTRPQSAEDFASHLFAGAYTVDASAVAASKLREKLANSLADAGKGLKKTYTKEAKGELSSDELDATAAIYDKQGSKLIDKLVRDYGLSRALFQANPPKDGRDFAQKFLSGAYSSDSSEQAKASLRSQMKAELAQVAGGLKRTTTKEAKGELTNEELTATAAIYDKEGPKLLEKLVSEYGLSKALIDANPPKDGHDFAKKFLSGEYSADSSETAKSALRKQMKMDLEKAAGGLKRTTTKEASGEPTEAELNATAAIYDKEGPALLKRLVEEYGLSQTLIDANPPKDGKDFAKKLMSGVYSAESSEQAKAALRQQMKADLTKVSQGLKRTETKEATGQATFSELNTIAVMYDREGPALLEKVVKQYGLNKTLLDKSPPTDGLDFAKKLLSGVYSMDGDEEVAGKILVHIKDDLRKQASTLKRTATKESKGELNDEDLDAIANIYLREGEHLINKLVNQYGISRAVIDANPPEGPLDFARKFLSGAWNVDLSEAAKLALRKEMKNELTKVAGGLKRTTTKEATGEPTQAELDAIAAVYDKEGAQLLDKMVKDYGLSKEKLDANMPKDGQDFAKKFLSGVYSADASEQAKSKLRSQMKADLAKVAGGLKRTTTKESTGEASKEDLAAIAAVYDKEGPQLIEKLVKQFALSKPLFEANKPKDGQDFAKKFLSGVYSVDSSSLASAKFLSQIKGDLSKASGNLKRTTTKEANGELTKEDLDATAAIFEKEGTKLLDKLVNEYGVSRALIDSNPPMDGQDFAKKFLSGAYFADNSESAKADLRRKMAAEMTKVAGGLKRTTTKEATGEPTKAELDATAAIYDKEGPKLLERLVSEYGLSKALIDANPPKDGKDFAQKFLSGVYSADASETAKAALRKQMKMDLEKAAGGLKRTQTKESSGEPTKEEIAAIAAIYDKEGAKLLEKLVKQYGVSKALIDANPPKDGEDFAKKFLAGVYSTDSSGKADAKLLSQIKDDLKNAVAGLKRTATKEATGELSKEELDATAAIYDKEGPKLLERLVSEYGLSKALIDANPPKDGQDFAKKFLSGVYSADNSETAKASLRSQMKADLAKAAKGLKRTTTKEASGEPSQQELDATAAIYDKEGPKLLERLVSEYGLSKALIDANPPKDGKDFAKKLLSGAYSADGSETAKAALRNQMKEDLAKAAGGLKRTTTKEATGEATKEELDAIAAIYNKEGPKLLEKLVKEYGVSKSLLDANPPKDGQDFAKKFLSGAYSTDSAQGHGRLLSQIKSDLTNAASNLKRTTTKEGKGELSKEELDATAAVYDKEGPKLLEKLVSEYGLSKALIDANPPKDGQDFAKKFLSGVYSEDNSESAKQKLRSQMKSDLEKVAIGLKRTTTKEAKGELSKEDLDATAAIYDKEGPKLLERLVSDYGLSKALIDANPPKDGHDFAKKFLSGAYSADSSESAKLSLRSQMKADLAKAAGGLKRTATKEATGELSQDEIAAFAAIYDKDGPKLIERLVSQYGISQTLIDANPPKDGQDFAKKFFSGAYSADSSETAKLTLRKNMQSDLLKAAGALKRTTTKEGHGELTQQELDATAAIYDKEGPKLLEKLVAEYGLSQALIDAHPPKDGKDFAQKFLSGVYSADSSEQAKAALRSAMKTELSKIAGGLKRTTTKEATGQASPEELKAVANIYDQCGGSLPKLAQMCGMKTSILEKTPPKDGQDFAAKLLSGAYDDPNAPSVGFKSVLSRVMQTMKAGGLLRTLTKDRKQDAAPAAAGGTEGPKLPTDLARTLTSQKGTLKRTTTKEGGAAPTAGEIEVVAGLYEEADGNLEQLQKELGLSMDMLLAKKPKDAADFAKNLLAGHYTTEPVAEAMGKWRKTLGSELTAKKGQMKRTNTREGGEVDQEDVILTSTVYTQYKGDLELIAKNTGLTLELLELNPPKDALDFGHKVLAGAYTADLTPEALAALKEKLKQQVSKESEMDTRRQLLTRGGSKLAGSKSGLKTFEPSPDQLQLTSKLFDKYNGDPKKLAYVCGVDASAIMKDPPANGKEFAVKLLNGSYVGANISDLTVLLQRQRGSLMRVQTKEGSGRAGSDDVKLIAEVYNKHGGNLEKLSEVLQIPLDWLQKLPPKDATDFAEKLLAGFYIRDTSETAKTNLREALKSDLQRQASSLKRTNTKEGNGQASADDIRALDELWTKHGGNLEELAKLSGASVQLLQARPPKSGEEWATRLLAGAYHGDSTAMSRAQLLGTLRENLQESSGKLRKVATKEYSGPSKSDLDTIEALYKQNNGDLDKLATALALDAALLKEKKPADGQTFAKQLLEGAYHRDAVAYQTAQWRTNLASMISSQKDGLKRTTTRTSTGLAAREDIDAVGKLYTELNGDWEKLADKLGLDLALIEQNPPENAEDFGKKLLEGTFSWESQDALRRRLGEMKNQLKGAMAGLKRTTTKERALNAAPEAADKAAMVKLYTTHSGDLRKLAALCGASLPQLQKNPPKDAEDFAEKFLRGAFSEN